MLICYSFLINYSDSVYWKYHKHIYLEYIFYIFLCCFYNFSDNTILKEILVTVDLDSVCSVLRGIFYLDRFIYTIIGIHLIFYSWCWYTIYYIFVIFFANHYSGISNNIFVQIIVYFFFSSERSKGFFVLD